MFDNKSKSVINANKAASNKYLSSFLKKINQQIGTEIVGNNKKVCENSTVFLWWSAKYFPGCLLSRNQREGNRKIVKLFWSQQFFHGKFLSQHDSINFPPSLWREYVLCGASKDKHKQTLVLGKNTVFGEKELRATRERCCCYLCFSRGGVEIAVKVSLALLGLNRCSESANKRRSRKNEKISSR